MKLDELVPIFLGELPADPFNGASLHYRIDAAEYVIYSVGHDGVDNGGASEPSNHPADIVVRVRLGTAEPGPAPRADGF